MQETWKPITGAEGRYEVSDLGRIRSLDREVGHRWGGIAVKRGKVLKPRRDKDGYLFVTICTGGVAVGVKVHRVVAAHFLPPSDLPEVNHLDFDKANNAATNLEWTSRKGNHEHASAGGRFRATSNPNRAKKLSPEAASAIRAARSEGMTFAAIGAKFGISAPTALKVARGEIW